MSSKIFLLCFICVFIGEIHSSAIPMWEFLKQDEKISFLYSMFANQIEEFCSRTTPKIQNCNLELQKHGLKKLKSLTNDELDMNDPYQRNANDLLWATLMKGHQYEQTTPSTKTSESIVKQQNGGVTTTPEPNSIYDQNFGDFNSDASARIDNYYVIVPPPTPFMKKTEEQQYMLSSGVPQYYLNPNKNYDNFKRNNGAYTKFQLSHSDITSTPKVTTSDDYDVTPFILTGPFVFRVYPDGRPVVDENNNKQLPQDDDLLFLQMMKMRLPNL